MSKAVKLMELEAIREEFAGIQNMVVIGVNKLDCAADSQLRAVLRKKKIKVRRVKNSMARKVFAEHGLGVNKDDSYFTGTTMYAWSTVKDGAVSELCRAVDTEVNGAKTAATYKNKLVLKGAFAEGQPVAFELAKKMPTRAEAIANVLGLILSPASKIAGQILAPGANLASQLKTISEKEKASAEA